MAHKEKEITLKLSPLELGVLWGVSVRLSEQLPDSLKEKIWKAIEENWEA